MLIKPKLQFSSAPRPDRLNFFHHSLFRKVFIFEWILLILCIAAESLTWKYAPPDASAPNIAVSLIFLIIVGILSFFTPLEHGYWDRLCFLFAEIILLTGATAAGLARFVFPLFTVVIAKACLVLDRRGLLITGTAAFCAQLVWGGYKVAITRPELVAHGWTLKAFLTILLGGLLLSYVAIAVLILVGMLTVSLVAEQKSRMETEKLSKEVQALATELERMRIAREIHDSLGHTLTTLNIQLDLARKFARSDSARAEKALELAKQLATQSLDNVRLAVKSIRNSDFNLRMAVDMLLAELRETQSLDVHLVSDVPDLPATIGFQLYRVIQECLTNVIKHAEASQVSLQISDQDGQVHLRVSDNGRGLQGQPGDGFGIRGMKERVESMHGTLAICAEPEQGTRIEVSIPL